MKINFKNLKMNFKNLKMNLKDMEYTPSNVKAIFYFAFTKLKFLSSP